jgi:integrase
MLVEKVIVPRLGGVPLQRLTPTHLNGVYAELLRSGRASGKGGLSPKSVRHVHMVLRRSLADAVRWNRLQRNPADFADPPGKAASQPKMKTWTAEQLAAFLHHVREDRLYAAFLLAAMTGMRRGEVLGLRWGDVDLEAGRLSIMQTLIAPDYRMQFSTPKTAAGSRSVALDPGTVAALREHAGNQAKERAMLGFVEDSELVFTSLDGSPVHPHQFSQAFKQRAKEACLPQIRLHDLRHTYATLALQAGIHVKVVSERLGHASVGVTLDTYSHTIPAMQETAAALVATLVLGQEDAPSALPEPAGHPDGLSPSSET